MQKDVKQWIDIVDDSIEKGLKRESKLEDWVICINGMTTPEIKCFLNNLNSHGKTNYLEIGAWRGSTASASLFKNEDLTAFVVDNFSQFHFAPTPEESERILLDNLRQASENKNNYTFINKDCWLVTKEEVNVPIDVYLYDGHHSYESQYRGVADFIDFMSDNFVLLVDDYNEPGVEAGTLAALKDLRDKVKLEKDWTFKVLPEAQGKLWHNGFYIAVLSKIK